MNEWRIKGEKPDIIGVINISCQTVNQSGTWYAYFDGEQTGPWSLSIKGAFDNYNFNGSGFPLLETYSWRYAT